MSANKANLFHLFYQRVLGELPDAGAKEFIKHLSWIGIAFTLAKVISSLVNIAAGRMLGPQEYGKISVLVSTGAAITPFLVAGLGSAVIKCGVIKNDRDKVFSTAGAVFLCLVIVISALTLLLRTHLSAFFGIEVKMLVLALAYAVATSSFLMASSMQQAAGGFPARGLSEIIFSVLLAAGFFLGVNYWGRLYEAMAAAYIAAFGCVALFWLVRIGRYTKLSLLNKEQFLRLSEYSGYFFGSSLASFLLFNVQSLILNAFLPQREVGVYSAYYTATIGIAGYLGYAISTVLFPKASASTNRRRLWGLAAKGWLYALPAVILLFLAIEAAALYLMGRVQYNMELRLMIPFAICGALLLVQSSLSQIMASGGRKASRLALLMTCAAGTFNFLACLLLVPRFGITGAAFAFICTYTLMLLWLWQARDSYLE